MEEYWFAKEQKKEYLKYLDQFGFCVITGVLDKDLIESRISEIWNHPALLGNNLLKRDDPSTWTSENGWNTDNAGFLDLNGGTSETELEYYWKVRLNKNIVDVFKTVYEEDVVLLIDRTGIMRPTKNIEINGEFINKPEWQTRKGWLHLDSNPWEKEEKIKLQGLVTLTDQTEKSGGFCCIPGFHRKLEKWALTHERTKVDGIYFFDKDAEEQTQAKKIFAPAGSLIIWNNKTAHSNYPNDGNSFRITDYLTYERKSEYSEDIKKGLKRIGLESVICDQTSYFPNSLTQEEKEYLDFDRYSKQITTEKEIEGYKLYKKGCQLECEGDVMAAIKLYQKSYKMCPILEDI